MGTASKAHQTVTYSVVGGTIALPTLITIVPPTWWTSGSFIVTNLIAEGVTVATLEQPLATVKASIRSAAATNTETAIIIPGLIFYVTYAAPLILQGVGAGTARVIGYWE